MAADVGFGTTVDIGTGEQAEVYEVTWGGIERAEIETTNLVTSPAQKTFIPSDVYDPGTMDFTLAFDATAIPTIASAATPWSVDWYGAGAGSIWTASMFMTTFGQTASIEERVDQEISCKVSGAITVA